MIGYNMEMKENTRKEHPAAVKGLLSLRDASVAFIIDELSKKGIDETIATIGGRIFRRHINLDTSVGGFVESTASAANNAYIGPKAFVLDKARVSDYAKIYDGARVYGGAWVSDYSQVYDGARVFDNARVSDYAKIYGNVCGKAQVYGSACVKEGAWVHGGWAHGKDQVYGEKW